MRKYALSLVLVAIFATASSRQSVLAQSYPSRLIRIVVPTTAGGPLDLLTRAMAEKVSAALGQTIVIENKPGAAGNLGSEFVTKSDPDGYTLLAALGTTLTVNPHVYKAMPFNALRDLRPISNMGYASQMLVVHPSVPVNSLSEFIAFAKKEPVSYAHAGPGSPGHLAMEYFRLKTGIKEMHPIPYRGNAQLSTDLVAGQVKVGFVSTSGVIQHVQAGRLKAFAVSSKERSQLAPDVPTIAESGYPDFEFVTYFMLLAPSAVPNPVVQILEREVRNVLKTGDMQSRFAPQDTKIIGSSAAEAAASIKSEYDLWADVAKAADMKLD